MGKLLQAGKVFLHLLFEQAKSPARLARASSLNQWPGRRWAELAKGKP